MSANVVSMALRQWYNCPSAHEVTMKNIDKTNRDQITTKLHQVETVYIFIGVKYGNQGAVSI